MNKIIGPKAWILVTFIVFIIFAILNLWFIGPEYIGHFYNADTIQSILNKWHYGTSEPELS
jgi:hypothetical protein